MAFAQVTVAATCIEKQRRGYQAISLTHFADLLEPEISIGSTVEIGDALFEADANLAITGWGGIAVSSDVYIKLAVAGAAITAAFTITAPTWSASKQGWYNVAETERYIGGLYKDASGDYTEKYLYRQNSGGTPAPKEYGNGRIEAYGGIIAGSGNATLLKKIIEIGDWNMDSTSFVNVPHGVTTAKIRSVNVIIRNDDDTMRYPLHYTSGGLTPVSMGQFYVSGANVYCGRTTNTNPFDGADFNSTSYNRGWVIIEYIP
jgi:hypothetical protein